MHLFQGGECSLISCKDSPTEATDPYACRKWYCWGNQPDIIRPAIPLWHRIAVDLAPEDIRGSVTRTESSKTCPTKNLIGIRSRHLPVPGSPCVLPVVLRDLPLLHGDVGLWLRLSGDLLCLLVNGMLELTCTRGEQ